MAEHIYKNNDTWSVEQGSIAPQLDYNRKPKYIVKNCPAYQKELYTFDAETGIPITTDTNYCINPFIKNCVDCNDCVIKQVIELCKKEAVINYPKKEKEFITVNGYQAILNMFDIEEINK